ncbi:MAG TPA: SRPBCC family protein [Cyclobacteriaceae bacterium]|nr:SRPBCC family protein [Cyclobacteriaceae bacterium]
MKALKIIGITLTFIVVAFLGIGLIMPSYEYQSSIEVSAPVAKCWDTFHDVKKMNQWLRGFESLTLISGDSLAVGSLYEIVVTDDGHRMVMTEKLTEVNAPMRISYELKNEVLTSEYTFSFEGNSPTKITSRYKITGNNILWKSILFLSKSYMTGSAADQLSSLKTVIEQP